VYCEHPGFTKSQLKRFVKAIERQGACFAHELSDIKGYKGSESVCTIPLNTNARIHTPPRNYGALERQIMDEKCREMRDAGIIVQVPSGKGVRYASAPTMPMKKDADGKWTDRRFCIDFRALNEATLTEPYGLHTAEHLFSKIQGSKFFSKIDLRSGFHQMPVAAADQPKTAFWWGNQLWMFVRMPFGLKNASSIFQRIMDAEIINAQLSHCACSFIDDILIHSATAEQHIQDVERVLAMLASVGLYAHPAKSVFGAEAVEYLGHLVSAQGRSPLEAKVVAIQALPEPTSKAELQHVLGIINYYRCYIPSFAAIANPIHKLLRKGVQWDWSAACSDAFQQLKQALTTPGLVLRHADPARRFYLHTD
jgi:hypothetical protein